MSRILLKEYFQPTWKKYDGENNALTESRMQAYETKSGLYLVGKIQSADTRNGNGRIYPRAILEREMKKMQPLIEANKALGELDHPDSAIISLSNVSHILTEYWWEGNDVIGKIKVLNTPSGRIIKEIVADGVDPGISSRGMGSLSERHGSMIVGEDLELKCYDLVHEPSTTGAYMTQESTINEGLISGDKAINELWRIINEGK